jgi:hypothetical protein
VDPVDPDPQHCLLGCVVGDPLEDLLQLAAVEGPEGGGGEYQLYLLLPEGSVFLNPDSNS